MATQAPLLSPADFSSPAIRLSGTVDQAMYLHFRDALAAAPTEGLAVVEIATLGGDSSRVTMDEILRRAPENWYLEANEAAALGLVAAVL